MSEAVGEIVTDGSSVALGLGLEALIPFAAGHEIIRQRRRELTLIGPISDILFDQLIGAGCVARVRAAWAGNVSAGLGHCYRRAAERGEPRQVEIHDHSNFTMALALLAGSLGAPFLPAKTLLGSDLPKTNPGLRVGASPLSGEPLLLVEAIKPDVAIVHVQRADEFGGCHAWGNLGVMEDAVQAASNVIVVAEDIVSSDVIASDPNRVLAPPHKVTAVVHEPGGAHPSPVQGRFGRDHAFFTEYHAATTTAAGFAQWRAEWIDNVADR
ncbi:MAG TPA: CoA-transferase, partial [Candidatus Eremiobacteraceae bacterium]|nr:CoA-transferase [Candidatus Eremiobacteraceae bacterium]